MTSDLVRLTAAQTASGVAGGEVSAVEVAQDLLKGFARLDPSITEWNTDSVRDSKELLQYLKGLKPGEAPSPKVIEAVGNPYAALADS